MPFKFDDLLDHANTTDVLYADLCSLKSEYYEMLQSTVAIGIDSLIIDDVKNLCQKLDENFKNAKMCFNEKDLGEFATYAEKCSNESEHLCYLLLRSVVNCVDLAGISSQEFENKAKQMYMKTLDFSVSFRILASLI